MARELIYTSAPKGLQPNSRGFCTVGASQGLPRRERMTLEGLSGYEFVFNLSDDQPERNPTNHLHTRVMAGGQEQDVLSRVSFCGADYSNRTNKIAHHLLVSPGERLPHGPAWVLTQLGQGHLQPRWEGDPTELPERPLEVLLGKFRAQPRPAGTWKKVTGDAGWGGALARAFRRDPKTPAFVIFEPGVDLLALFTESLAILTAEERWNVCFATYFTSLPPNLPCHWRGVLAGSKAAEQVRRFPRATVVDLTTTLGECPTEDAFTRAAREGKCVAVGRAAASPAGDSGTYGLLEADDPDDAYDVDDFEPASPRGHWRDLTTVKRPKRPSYTAPIAIVLVAALAGLALLTMLFATPKDKVDTAVDTDGKDPLARTERTNTRPPVRVPPPRKTRKTLETRKTRVDDPLLDPPLPLDPPIKTKTPKPVKKTPVRKVSFSLHDRPERIGMTLKVHADSYATGARDFLLTDRNATALLRPPTSVLNSVDIRTTPTANQFDLLVREQGQLKPESPVATLTLAAHPHGARLLCAPNPDASPAALATLDVLVIEVQNLRSRLIHQCLLRPRDEQVHRFEITYLPLDHLPHGVAREAFRWSVEYPLEVEAGEGVIGTTTGLALANALLEERGGPGIWSQEDENRRVELSPTVAFSFRFQRKKQVLRVALSDRFLRSVDRSLEKWQRGDYLRLQRANAALAGVEGKLELLPGKRKTLYAQLTGARKKGDETEVLRVEERFVKLQAWEKDLKSQLKRLKKRRKDLRKSRKTIEKTQRLFQRLDEAAKSLGDIVILDPWGVPLKRLRVACEWSSLQTERP